MILSPLLGRGQTAVIPAHTGTITSFPTWTHTNNTQGSNNANDYLVLLTSTSALVTPAINLAGYSAPQLNFRARTFGGPSTAQATISVSISIDNGANYSAPVTRLPTSTTLTSVATIDLSAYSGNQIKARIQTLGAASGNGVGIDDISVSGTSATPTITAGPLTPSGNFTTTQGIASVVKAYILTANNLTAPLTVGPLTGYGFSTDAFSTAGLASLSLAPDGAGAVSATVSVRLTTAATATGSPYNGSIANASAGATSQNVVVSGTVTAAATASAPGLLLLEDNFNYVPGTKLNANGWAIHLGLSNANADAPTVVAGNLTNASYPTGSLASNANRVSSSGTSTAVNKGFTVPSGSNTLYYSALINIPTGGTRADHFLHLLQRTNVTGTNAQDFRAKLFARPGIAANTFKLGISVAANLNETPAPSYGSAEYAEGQTYLVVVKYLYAPGGNDVVSLFVFDNATTIPVTEPTTAVASLQQANNAAFSLPNGIAIRQSTSSSIVGLDGIRVATGWGAVVGNPVYTEATAVINAGNYYAVTMNDAAARLTPNGNINVENNLALTNGLINTAASNSLTLNQSATVSGGGNTSFVNGPVLRPLGVIAATATPLSFTFPVGQGSFYRPITLNLTEHKAASLYTASQTEGNPSRTLAAGSGLGTAPLARVSTKRYYTVTSSNTTPGNFTGTITLSFGAEDYVNVPSNPDFVIAKRDATGPSANQWTNLGRSGNTGTDSGAGGPSTAGTLTSASFSDFSDFVLGAQNGQSSTNAMAAINPLPVELTTFSALRQASNAVAVKWATASEKNSARFEVERSPDGREFAVVATATARGNSATTTVYAILDKTAPAATLYYRLRQVDLNGTAVHSPVVMAGTGVAAKSLLYPNPTRSSIHFFVEVATPYRVLNQLGQGLLHGTTESGTATIVLNALAPGLYFLELQTANGRVMQNFEKTTD